MVALWLLLAVVLVNLHGCAVMRGNPTTQPTTQPTPEQQAEIAAAKEIASYLPYGLGIVAVTLIGIFGPKIATRKFKPQPSQ